VPAALAQVNPVPTEGGDPNILTLPEHTKGLGQGVATDGYGKPSKYEANVQRRQSPGLTQTTQSSVSFAPLQSLFGIVTPSGLHFERHHQGWWDIDPSKHRLMINGMVKPKVFTMDEIMRLPSVSRFHFIECGANTGMEWGNVAVPTVQYSHGMLSCSEFTGVPLITLLEMAGADLKAGKYVLAEGADGSSMTRTIPDEPDPLGRSPGRLWPERRDAAPRKRLPAAAGGAWRPGGELGQVPAAPRGGRPALGHQGRGGALHRPDARRPASPVHQHAGVQERGDHAVGRPGAAGQGLLQRDGLAWSGRGKVKRVDVSVDGGRNWRPARLETPVLSPSA
jgi:sulfane dehydrogenase subunit SoxC